MPRKLKIKFYMTVVRSALLYKPECWTVRKKEEHILEINRDEDVEKN